METADRCWPPILGLGLSAALGYALTLALGLPALCLGFLLLRAEDPLPWTNCGGLLASLRRAATRWLAVGFFLGCHAALVQARQERTSIDPRGQTGLVRFEGTLIEDGRQSGFGQVEARIRAGPELLTLSMPRTTLLEGSSVRGLARLDRGSTRGYLHSSAELLEIREPWLESVRSRFRGALDRALHRALSPRVAVLVHRLLLGRDKDLPPSIERAHRRFGLSHLLAISGMHTLFLAAFVSWLLRPLAELAGGELRLLVPLLLAYAWLTGSQPPVIRAVIGYLFWRICWARGWPFDIGSCLGFAALVVLALFPQDFASLSFLLSYSATVALVCLLGPMRRRILGHSRLQRWLVRWPMSSWVLTLLLASVAAQIGTAALSLQAFGHLAPWGILATPLLLPLLFLALGLGVFFFVTIPLTTLHVPVATLLELVGQGWLELVQAFPDVPGAPLQPLSLPSTDLSLMLLFGLAVLAFLLRSKRVLLLAFLAPVLPWFLPLPIRQHARFTLLSVGHGLCAQIQVRDRIVVFDCGDLAEGRRATRALLAWLRETGRTRVDDLILSHADHDHAAGLPELLLRLRIGRIWLPESPKAARILRWLAREHSDIRILPPGSIESLGPGTLLLAPHDNADLAGSNDGGLVLHHRFPQGPDLLLTGDQEEAGTAALLRSPYLPDHVELLVLPHHGSSGSRFERLVRRFTPRYCLASTGSRRKVDRSGLDGVAPRLPLLTTGSCGTITVHRADTDRWRIRSQRGPEIIWKER